MKGVVIRAGRRRPPPATATKTDGAVCFP